MDLLKNLNNNQKEAVLHTEGPLLILAGAGSGKTRVITHRIAHLINDKHVRPYNIFAVTFTNKAAEEMRNRLVSIIGPSANSVFVKTFHSAAVYIIRRFGEEIGITSNFTIYDAKDQDEIIKRILISMKIDHKKVKPSSISSKISEIKDSQAYIEGTDLSHLAPDYHAFDFMDVFKQYEEDLKKNNALDFNDLLIKTVQLLRNSDTALSDMQYMWKYFMIDEYQDTNYSQYLIAKYLASHSKNICVVGDDDQSIYSWRGADIRNILNFEKDYNNARIITLEENYRSTSGILDAAYAVIQNNSQRKNKSIIAFRGEGELVKWCQANNEYGEGDFVVNTILSLKSQENLSNKDFAVFYRTNAQSRIFEDVMRREGLPYRIIGGLKFYDRKEIKDVLAYLKFLTNVNDTVSLFRVINTPARGIGKATQDKITDLTKSMNIDEWKVVDDELITGRIPKGLYDFKKIINSLQKDMKNIPGSVKLSDFVKSIVDKSGYRKALSEDNSVESTTRLDNIDEFINSIYEYEQMTPDATPEQFIQDISLYTSEQNPDDEDKDNCITLMTIHNAKGLEFPVVFLTGMEENTFPHKLCVDSEDALEEERRLCYVGITRAMDQIYLTSTEIRRSFAGIDYKQPSRFISEIPAELLEVKHHESTHHVPERAGSFSQQKSYFGSGFSQQKSYSNSGFSGLKRASEISSPQPKVNRLERSDNGSKFEVKERVVHPRFGIGRIVKIEGSGDNVKLTISFGMTKKVFMEKYTPLDRFN